MQGILTKDTYMCPKCDVVEVYAYLEQTRSSDEPETRMLTCKDQGNGERILIRYRLQLLVLGSI